MKSIPSVKKYMTTIPIRIAASATIPSAIELMKRYNIRHLPITEKGELEVQSKLVGVLSERDIHYLQTTADIDLSQEKVEKYMHRDPFCVASSTPIDKVAHKMAELKLGSAVVVDDQIIVGIFTAIDAMTALHDICNELD